MNKNFTITSIAAATGFSTPWTQRMLATGRGRHLTVAQISARLGLCKVYLYKMINRGILSAHKYDGKTCVTFRNLAKWRLSVVA